MLKNLNQKMWQQQKPCLGVDPNLLCPGALLLLWAPAAPLPDQAVDRAKHAKSAATAYSKRFSEIVAAGRCSSNDFSVAPILHAWRSFLTRWMGALQAAESSAEGTKASSFAFPIKARTQPCLQKRVVLELKMLTRGCALLGQ